MLQQINIKNFRIFGGDHTIYLSTNKSKPFTVISTITASGKTTLVNAIEWCLGKSRLAHALENLINVEESTKLQNGKQTFVSVELVFSEKERLFCFKREICIEKTLKRLVLVKEKYYINGESYTPYGYGKCINLCLPLWQLTTTQWNDQIFEKNFALVLQKEIACHVEREKEIDSVLADIAVKATDLFAQLCNTSTFLLSWSNNAEIKMYKHTDDGCWYEYMPSSTLATASKLAFLLATFQVLNSKIPSKLTYFFVIDDILQRADPSMLSINELGKVLFPYQVLFLTHQNSISHISEQVTNRIGQRYSMIRSNENWTNVQIETISG